MILMTESTEESDTKKNSTTEDTEVMEVLHQAYIPNVELLKSSIVDNSVPEICLTEKPLMQITAAQKFYGNTVEANQSHIDVLTFFNDNGVDITTQEISAFEKNMGLC